MLEPVDALSVDGFSVGGMSVQRISGDGDKYYMWYAGVPENEFAQRIYLATSTRRHVVDQGAGAGARAR